MEHRSLTWILFVLGVGSLVTLAYIIYYCFRKRKKSSGGDEESLQGILTEASTTTRETPAKTHNGFLNLKAPLLKSR